MLDLVTGAVARDDEGNEWMWIEVLRWDDDHLNGVLQNDPFHIKDLKEGAKVSVKVGDAFDYILYHSDGTMEGNETGKLIEQQQLRDEE